MAVSTTVNAKQRLLSRRRVDERGCWLWTLSCNRKGYGQTWLRLEDRYIRNGLVHRIAAHLWLNFDLDSDLFVLHHCDTPGCFNPDHLYIGTAADNSADMVAKGRGNGGRLPGSTNPCAKLTEDDVREIRRLRGRGELLRTLAERFGVSKTKISQVCLRHNWTHI